MSEDRARAEIVAYGRLAWERRLTSGSSGNLSVRLDDGDMVITPARRSLRSLDPGELVLLDSHGNARDSSAHPTSELPLHIAAYRARSDIRCVVHTHPTFSVVWSRIGHFYARDTVGTMESLGTCAWTPYRKNGTKELAEICAREFARGIDLVMMERHGLTAIAASLEDAFVQTDLAEEGARIAYYTQGIAVATTGNERST